MPESRIAQFSTNPLVTAFAISSSQAAIRPVARFIAPFVEVGDITGRYKKYTDANRYRLPSTRRTFGSKATMIGFTADDVPLALNPSALDFPIPNVDALSDEALQYAIMEGQSMLADVSALSHEDEVITAAIAAGQSGKLNYDFSLSNDPIAILDNIQLAVTKAAKNGAPIKILFGATAFKKFRNNANVRNKFIVSNRGGGNANVGTVSPTIGDVSGLLMLNPETQLSMYVKDTSAPGTAESISFLLDDTILVFASNSAPNRMDPSFMKTFVPMGGFFKPGTYTTEDQRDQVMKMDWTSQVAVTNTVAVQLINTATGATQS